MEEKKTIELTDETLDEVTGGAEIKYDQSTNTHYAFTENHEVYYTTQNRDAAISAMHNLGFREQIARLETKEPVMISPPTEPVD